MALLSFPYFPSHFPSLSFSPNTRRCSPSFKMSAQQTATTAIVWFKHDLRIHDHPALTVASSFQSLLPLYVFDRRILSRFSDEMLELLLFALQDLRNSLKERGSNLMIRFGNAEHVIQQLASEVNASCVFAEQEVEYELYLLLDVMKECMKSVTVRERAPRIELWNTPFYDVNVLQNLPASYDDFKKLRLPVTEPLQLSKLPAADMELDWGTLPVYDDVKNFITSNQGRLRERWNSIKLTSAETLLRNKIMKSSESSEGSYDSRQLQSKKSNESVFLSQKGYMKKYVLLKVGMEHHLLHSLVLLYLLALYLEVYTMKLSNMRENEMQDLYLPLDIQLPQLQEQLMLCAQRSGTGLWL